MKLEVLEWFLHSSGVADNYHIFPPAPYRGPTVINPKPTKIPRHMRPMFPGHETLWHRPELHTRHSPIMTSWGTAVAVPLVISYPFVLATASYPSVAASQYQSSITGQPGGTDPNLLFGEPQGFDYFLKNF